MIRAQYFRMESAFNALSLRERILLALALAAMLVMAAQYLFYAPLIQQIRSENKQQQDLAVQREQLMQELAVAKAHAARRAQQADPTQSLQQQLDAVNLQISTLAGTMVPPEKMAALLRDLLARQQGLQLVELQKLPVTDAQTAATAKSIGLYQHRLQITLRGDYFSTLQYLQMLEQSPWRLYWETLDYQVDKYPQALITVELATLGKSEDWIGG